MKKEPEYISTTEALAIIKKSWLAKRYQLNLQSLINWIKKYNLGFKFAGRWNIDKIKFMEFIKKDIVNGNTKKKKAK